MPGLLFGSLLVFFIVGVPIAVALGAAVLLTVYTGNVFGLEVIPQQIFNSMNSFPLMAIPFFILAGFLMQEGGISKRLVDFAQALVGHLTGGLAITMVITTMFFAAISGSGAATTAAIGSIMIPAMVASGYLVRYASGLQATAGALGVILPPSIPLIIYAIAANASVGDMFIAAIIPGVFITSLLLIVAYIMAKRRGDVEKAERTDLKTLFRAFLRAVLALIMPVLVLGGIYGGVFTPTEAAVVAVAYAFLIGVVVYREIPLHKLGQVFTRSALTTAIVMIIIGAAGLFGFLLTRLGVPGTVATFFDDANFNAIMFLIVVNILLFVMGMFIEAAAAILIVTPIILPLAIGLGIDPIHFGVIIVVNLAVGLVTPPVGINLFVAAQIGELSILQISRAVLPFLAALIVGVLVITYVPALSTWLPGILEGGTY
jgi:C4-dicarboxylate transporter, DctM subunit